MNKFKNYSISLKFVGEEAFGMNVLLAQSFVSPQPYFYICLLKFAFLSMFVVARVLIGMVHGDGLTMTSLAVIVASLQSSQASCKHFQFASHANIFVVLVLLFFSSRSDLSLFQFKRVQCKLWHLRLDVSISVWSLLCRSFLLTVVLCCIMHLAVN